ncbi:hypothetical protein D8674_016894 [Pyrus ussuriensis x Pyrus communis]|uniref:CW-type domain-containing protein n=1 Tax=Pyrus ussuriensis x Pyrus communis TaxID=2448454 RepID=A0A5N5HPK8_9ROSA|nr:hypothetical protein D8674_016894 [Pyrus ussuriensis x Pyrus communis]
MEGNNTELEEGEAPRNYKDDDEGNLDPDNDLSYIDERIQNALGHFMKDFEAGNSVETLGAKYGGYGTFLPSHERSPSILSHPKTPQINYNTSRSPKCLTEGDPQNLKAFSNAHPNVRPGTANSAHLSHNSRVLPGDISVKRNLCLPPTQVAERCSVKDETSNRQGNPTDQRTLKVRIKMNPDNTAQKNVAIYSDLGLGSPSLSLENSPEESRAMKPPSQVIVDNSSTNIIQVMTSFPVPGDALISPLHDSLLCLVRKRKLYQQKQVPSSKGHQEHSSLSVMDSVSTLGNSKVSKETRIKASRKGEIPVALKLENGIKNNTKIIMKKKSETGSREDKELVLNDLKATPLSNSVFVGNCLKVIGKTPEASREANENEVKGKLSSSELVKEEPLELISDQGGVKNEKQSSRYGSVEKVWEQKDIPVDLRDDVKCKDYQISASKDDSDVSKCKEEEDLHKHNVGKEGTSREQAKTNVRGKRPKLSSEGKAKSKENQSKEKSPSISTKERLEFEMGVAPKDKLSGGHGVPQSNIKIQKSKSQNGKVRDNQRVSVGDKRLEQRDKMDLAERPAADVDVKLRACLDKPREKWSGKKSDNQLLSKDVPVPCQQTKENGLASELVPAAAAPVIIEEHWVCCDSCQKWRLLPLGTKPEQLPEKWLCSMLNWLPGMNLCDISEEETTKALQTLYQMPSSEGINKLQTHANGTASAVPAVDVLHLDQNLSSHTMSNQGKKKHGLKELPNASNGSGLLNSTKNHLQVAVKSISSNDINQPPLESNVIKKSSFRHTSKVQNLKIEKTIPKQKEKQTSEDNARALRLKNKEEDDQHIFGTSKKLKRGDMWHADKNTNSNVDIGMVCVGSSTGLLTQAHGQDVKYNDLCRSEGTKDVAKDKLQVSAKKLKDQIQVSLHGGALDVRTGSRDGSMKKRKMREWQDTQNNVETLQNFGHEGKLYTKEESSESGYRKEKRSRILKSNGKESSTGNGDDRPNIKIRATNIVISGTKINSIHVVEKDRSIVKDQQPKKHSKKNASQQTFIGVNSLGRDSGSGHVSLAATSSSSKVSGSHKTRVNFEEVKGSPVESVSSSPLRTSNADRLTSARGDALGKDDSAYGGFPLTNNGDANIFSSVGYEDGDANGELNVTAKPSSEVWNSHLLSGNNDGLENGQCLSNQHGMNHSHEDDRENKNYSGDAVCVQKSGKGSCLQSKDIVRSGTSNLDRNRMKVSDPVNDYSKKSQRYVSEMEPNYVHEKGNNFRHDLPEKCSTKWVEVKDENYHIGRGDKAGHGSSDSGVETQLKRKDHDASDVKFSSTQSPNRKGALQQNLIQNHEGGQMQHESRCGKPQLFSHCQGERKEETPSLCPRPFAGSERVVVFQGLPVDTIVNGDVPKSLKQAGTAANKNGVNCNLVHLMPDQQRALDVSAPSPVRNSSGQTATNTLIEAKRLRDYADYLKNSGFDFESSEAYFQAALKYLQGAVLLESCSSENGKHGDITTLQVYSTTAKLCELCAHEYESRQEVASAALAYKCMEVAYMRVVYCKHSSTNRDRHELQATFNMAPLGESPSSSASDLDNLNNQVMADKSILSNGAGSHVFGNHVVAAHNRSNFVRLLDFTQDVNFAMEASRKSQNAFAAACAKLGDAHKNGSISSIRRVIDFSFQDLEELIRLVKLAMEAISRSKFGGARD